MDRAYCGCDMQWARYMLIDTLEDPILRDAIQYGANTKYVKLCHTKMYCRRSRNYLWVMLLFVGLSYP